MRMAVAALLLTGCNQLFGIGQTEQAPLLDAQYFDAPADAPFACPPIGETPRYSLLLHQIIQTCDGYSQAQTGRAAAYCSLPKAHLAEGPADGDYAPIPGLEQTSEVHIDHARYAPEGDEIFVRHWLQSTTTGRIVSHRVTGGAFPETYDVTIAGRTWDSFVKFGSPTRGPRRRMMVYNSPATATFEEIELDASGVATSIGTYVAGDLAVNGLTNTPPNLSPDGLRLLFFTPGATMFSGVMYADRPSIDARFSAARILDGIPAALAPFMTEDCARVYVSVAGYIFWVQQQ